MNLSHVIAVSNRHLCRRPFPEQLERVCRLRPRALILREKDLSQEEYTRLALQAVKISDTFQVPLIPHTHVQTARMIGSSSIHLPLHLLEEYSGKLGDFSVIGTSVHSCEDARRAEALGATYLTAGHIYSTDCKKGLPPRGLSFLREICDSTALPVYAIGGIRPEENQLREILDCGAAGGCIMSGMMKI